MTSLTVHRVETVKVERTEWEEIAWTTIKVSDTDGIVTEITLHHAVTAAPLITQG
jgi:hypothetical protein